LTNGLGFAKLVVMNTTITIRTNSDIKKIAQARAKELGLSLSDVINHSLRRFAKGEAVVYDDDFSEEYIEELAKISKRVDRDYKAGKYKNFMTGDEAVKFLDDIIAGKA
jgi:antitoxin component of RelBE/YafQ-DinJ toxin-antitoxin module